MKICIHCKEQKPESEFYPKGRGLTGACKPCVRIASSKSMAARRAGYTPEQLTEFRGRRREATERHRAKNPEYSRNKSRSHHLRKTYGITLEHQNEMMQDQEGRCAICVRPIGTGRNLSVDHCHVTRVVRGILCNDCNLGLGNFKDDPWVLGRAIAYLVNNMSPQRLENLRRITPSHIHELNKVLRARVDSLRNGA